MTDIQGATVNLDEEVEALITKRVEKEVRDKLEQAVAQEEDKRFRQMKWFVGLVGLVGLGTFGTLSNYLIEKAVESKLEGRTGNISDSLDFVRFSSVSLKLELGTSFSNSDREAVMGYLRRASKNERVRHTPDFMAALTQVTRAFVSAGQSGSIDEIFALYEQETLSQNDLVENLIHHYGQTIVTRAANPREDTATARFEKLERVAGGAKVPELALYYRVLFTYQKNPDNVEDGVTRLIERASQLSTGDSQSFFGQIFERTKGENWQRRVDHEGLVFEKVTRGFLKTYAGTLSETFKVDRSLILRAAESGVAADEVRKLARKVVESRRAS